MRKLPGFVDVNTDLQIASPQVMVDIDRDRALALGVSPQQMQDALYSAYGDRQVSMIYAPADQYSVILRGGAAIPAQSRTRCRSSTCARRNGSLVPLDARGEDEAADAGPLSINHFGQLPAVTISFNLRPGFSLGQAADQVDNAIRELAHAADHQHRISRAR